MKMLLGILIGAAITAAIYRFIINDKEKAPSDVLAPGAPLRIDSEPIRWDSAKAKMERYDKFKPLKVKYKSNGKDTTPNLQGFVFIADHLDSIINNNRSKHGKNADKVIFYFGKDDDFDAPDHSNGNPPGSQGSLNAPRTKFAEMRMIAVGIKDNFLMVDSSGVIDKVGAVVVGATIFDKADPCPPSINCPTVQQ